MFFVKVVLKCLKEFIVYKYLFYERSSCRVTTECGQEDNATVALHVMELVKGYFIVVQFERKENIVSYVYIVILFGCVY